MYDFNLVLRNIRIQIKFFIKHNDFSNRVSFSYAIPKNLSKPVHLLTDAFGSIQVCFGINGTDSVSAVHTSIEKCLA